MPVARKKTATASAPKKATAAIIDFSNVKERGNFNTKYIEAGDYTAKITKVESVEAKDGEPMWVFHVVLDDVPRAVYPYYCKLVDNQYWKVKALFTAIGVIIGQRKVKVDPNKLIGKPFGVAMEDDEYEGRKKSVIAEVFPADEVDGVEEEEEEPTPAKRKKAAEPEEDEEEELEDEEEEEEEEEPEPPRKRAPAKKAPAKKATATKRRRPVDEDEEDEDELEIDEI